MYLYVTTIDCNMSRPFISSYHTLTSHLTNWLSSLSCQIRNLSCLPPYILLQLQQIYRDRLIDNMNKMMMMAKQKKGKSTLCILCVLSICVFNKIVVYNLDDVKKIFFVPISNFFLLILTLYIMCVKHTYFDQVLV